MCVVLYPLTRPVAHLKLQWDWATIGIPAVEQNYENILARQANGTYSTHGPVCCPKSGHEDRNADPYSAHLQIILSHVSRTHF